MWRQAWENLIKCSVHDVAHPEFVGLTFDLHHSLCSSSNCMTCKVSFCFTTWHDIEIGLKHCLLWLKIQGKLTNCLSDCPLYSQLFIFVRSGHYRVDIVLSDLGMTRCSGQKQQCIKINVWVHCQLCVVTGTFQTIKYYPRRSVWVIHPLVCLIKNQNVAQQDLERSFYTL